MSDKLEMPHWEKGTCWVLELHQRTPARTSRETWVGPSYLGFEVIEIDSDRIHLRAEALGLPENAEPIWAEAWLSAKDRRLIDGTLHIGDHSLTLQYDIFGQLLSEHPPGVDASGGERHERIFLGPNEPIEITTHGTVTETGAVRTSSRELPYHLRIEDERYRSRLVSWH